MTTKKTAKAASTLSTLLISFSIITQFKRLNVGFEFFNGLNGLGQLLILKCYNPIRPTEGLAFALEFSME